MLKLFPSNACLLLIVASISFFVSCEETISDIGTDLIDDNGVRITTDTLYVNTTQVFNVSAPRTDNLSSYLLGSKSEGNEVIGTYNLVTSLSSEYSVAVLDIDADEDAGIDSSTTYQLTGVDLVLPFEYSLDTDNTSLETESYTIESLINLEQNLEIEVYRSELNLLTTDPNTSTTQKYFADGSDGSVVYDPDVFAPVSNLLGTYTFSKSDLLTDQESLTFEVALNCSESTDGDSEPCSDQEIQSQFPVLEIPFDAIFKEELSELLVNSKGQIDISRVGDEDFKQALNGFYIKVINSQGAALVQLSDKISSFVNPGLRFTFEQTITPTDVDEASSVATVYSTLAFETVVNTISSSDDSEELSLQSDELILQCGLGSVIDVDLFSDLDFEALYEKQSLVQEAILEFTVNENSTSFEPSNLPNQLFINRSSTGSILRDYINNIDATDATNTDLISNHLNSVTETDDTTVYRINITQHLSQILGSNSLEDAQELDVNLLISLVEDIDQNISMQIGSGTEAYIPQSSLFCKESVSLYSNISEDLVKRPKLILSYLTTSSLE